jgi:hypothetical protein
MALRRLEKAERLGEENTGEIGERSHHLQPDDADRVARRAAGRRGKQRGRHVST